MLKKMFALGAIALCMGMAAAHASPLPDYPFVTASGKAEAWLAPDICELRFEIQAQDKRAELGQEAIETLSGEVLTMLAAAGVQDKDIDAFDITKKALELSAKVEGEAVLSYAFARHFTVHVRDLKAMAQIMPVLLAMNNVDSLSVSFDRVDRAQVEMRLAGEAAGNAREIGANLAAAFGRKLGPAMAISQNGMARVGVPFGFEAGGSDTKPPGPVRVTGSTDFAAPGAIPFMQAVNVVFKLRPN